MNTGSIILDEAIHQLLKEKGYRYFLITDLQLTNTGDMFTLTVKAEKQIPADSRHSCTGIDDPMITSFIYKLGMNCEIFVEYFQ